MLESDRIREKRHSADTGLFAHKLSMYIWIRIPRGKNRRGRVGEGIRGRL
jgi:hypothetical protein